MQGTAEYLFCFHVQYSTLQYIARAAPALGECRVCFIGSWLSAGVAQAKVAVPFQDSIRKAGSSTEASMSGYGMEGELLWLN